MYNIVVTDTICYIILFVNTYYEIFLEGKNDDKRNQSYLWRTQWKAGESIPLPGPGKKTLKTTGKFSNNKWKVPPPFKWPALSLDIPMRISRSRYIFRSLLRAPKNPSGSGRRPDRPSPRDIYGSAGSSLFWFPISFPWHFSFFLQSFLLRFSGYDLLFLSIICSLPGFHAVSAVSCRSALPAHFPAGSIKQAWPGISSYLRRTTRYLHPL